MLSYLIDCRATELTSDLLRHSILITGPNCKWEWAFKSLTRCMQFLFPHGTLGYLPPWLLLKNRHIKTDGATEVRSCDQ